MIFRSLSFIIAKELLPKFMEIGRSSLFFMEFYKLWYMVYKVTSFFKPFPIE